MNIIFSKVIKDKRLAVIAAASIVRMGYFGFSYFPLLDDYIQYGIYPSAGNPFSEIYLHIGLFAFRPLAGLGDIYVWGRLWGVMGIALFVITVLHAISAYLFILTSDKLGVSLGILFVVFYLLCPINFEGSYWISASSRIIVGLFFVSLSVYFLVHKKILFFFIFQFIAMMLYEQVAVLSFALSAMIIYQMKEWRYFKPLAVNFFIIYIYYKLFSDMGSFGSRTQIQMINIRAIADMARGWTLLSLYTNGFVRGLRMNIVYLVPIFIISSLLGVIEKNCKFNSKILFAGAVLFVAPYMPFLFLANNHASFRVSVVPLVGAAIFFDSAFNLLRGYKSALAVALSFVFLVVCVSELQDYRENYIVDRKIVSYVADNLDFERTNAVVGAKETYINQNVYFAEHIKSITSSDWALTGCVREYLGDRTIPMIQINPENTENINLISLFDF